MLELRALAGRTEHAGRTQPTVPAVQEGDGRGKRKNRHLRPETKISFQGGLYHMKAIKIEGLTMLAVTDYGVYLDDKNIERFLRDILRSADSEQDYSKIPARVLIQIEPLPTGLKVETFDEEEVPEAPAEVASEDMKKAS